MILTDRDDPSKTSEESGRKINFNLNSHIRHNLYTKYVQITQHIGLYIYTNISIAESERKHTTNRIRHRTPKRSRSFSSAEW